MQSLFRLVVFEIAFFVLGVFVTIALLGANDTNLSWRSLGTPPSKATRILDGNWSAVRVQTSNGNTYVRQFSKSGSGWVQSDQAIYYRTTPYDFKKYGNPPPMPSGVIDTKKFYSQASEYAFILSEFLVTQQGEVYVWQAGFGSPYDGLALYFIIPLTAIIGFIIWFGFEIVMHFPKQKIS